MRNGLIILFLVSLFISCKKSDTGNIVLVDTEQKDIEFHFDKNFYTQKWKEIENDTLSLENFLKHELNSEKYDEEFVINFLGGLIQN
ncbi:MAG: hypothetical protein ACK4FS_09230 [Flavobacterium sp.]